MQAAPLFFVAILAEALVAKPKLRAVYQDYHLKQ